MRWGKDAEERSAVALKAQDSYSIARQAMGRVEALEARLTAMEEELAANDATIGRLQRRVAALEAEPIDETHKKVAIVKQPVRRDAFSQPHGKGVLS